MKQIKGFGKFEVTFESDDVRKSEDGYPAFGSVYGNIKRDGMSYEAFIDLIVFGDGTHTVTNVSILPVYRVVESSIGNEEEHTLCEFSGEHAAENAWAFILSQLYTLMPDFEKDLIHIDKKMLSIYCKNKGITIMAKAKIPDTPWTRYIKKWNLRIPMPDGSTKFGWINTVHTGKENIPKLITGKFWLWNGENGYHGTFLLDHPEMNEDPYFDGCFISTDGEIPFVDACIEDCVESSYIENLGINTN